MRERYDSFKVLAVAFPVPPRAAEVFVNCLISGLHVVKLLPENITKNTGTKLLFRGCSELLIVCGSGERVVELAEHMCTVFVIGRAV